MEQNSVALGEICPAKNAAEYSSRAAPMKDFTLQLWTREHGEKIDICSVIIATWMDTILQDVEESAPVGAPSGTEHLQNENSRLELKFR